LEMHAGMTQRFARLDRSRDVAAGFEDR